MMHEKVNMLTTCWMKSVPQKHEGEFEVEQIDVKFTGACRASGGTSVERAEALLVTLDWSLVSACSVCDLPESLIFPRLAGPKPCKEYNMHDYKVTNDYPTAKTETPPNPTYGMCVH